MSLFFRLVIIVIISLTSYVSISATPLIDFTLAPQVYLSGTSSDARFDVAGALFDSGSPIPAPHIVTGTRTFSGAFYLSGAGWVLMSTGSYHVDLDCGTQSLTGITANCTLSGTAWSETIGDIIFDRRVEYLTGGTLSGVVWTWIGDQSLSGIMLPLRRAEITDADYTSVANHETQIDIITPQIYTTSGGSWNIEFNPLGVTFPEASTDPSHVFDLSIASEYDLIITDPNGSVTKYIYTIENDAPSMTLHADISTTRKYDACDPTPINITICPDGATLAPTSIVVDTHSLVADAQDRSTITMKFRDQYGNIIDTGTVDIVYHTPIQLIQTEESPYYTLLPQDPLSTPSYLGDALIFDSIFSTYNSLGNEYVTGSTSLVGGDISYSFRSYASGTISLESILYNSTSTSLTHDPIVFSPWLSVDSMTGPTEIRIGTGATFTTTVKNNSTEDIFDTTPNLITGLSIGDGLFAAFTDFTGPSSIVCQANTTYPLSYTDQCAWTTMGAKFSPSVLVQDIGTADATYTFSGNYTPLLPIAYVPPESTTGYSYISYEKDGKTVIYPSRTQIFGTSLFQNLRIRILGQTRADGWYEGIQVGENIKTELFNTIRKNVALLTRNRTDFSRANYTYTGGQNNIFDHDFDTKRTIIVEGDDVVIYRDIPRQDHPLAIIALKDQATGQGGDIRIASGVTDVHATLVAEGSVRSSGSGQLYIYGSIISHNSLGGARKTPRECPYFDNAPCTPQTAKKYDLEYLRDGYTSDPANWANSSTATKYRDTSVIIEYDPRIVSDPPPGLDLSD